MSLNYISDDGKAKVTVDMFELPQTDELHLVHLRVEFLDNIKVRDGDFARNVGSSTSRAGSEMRYTTVAYGGPTGSTTTSIKLNDDFTVAGAPLPQENGSRRSIQTRRGRTHSSWRFEGKLGGEDAAPGVSVVGWNSRADALPGDAI